MIIQCSVILFYTHVLLRTAPAIPVRCAVAWNQWCQYNENECFQTKCSLSSVPYPPRVRGEEICSYLKSLILKNFTCLIHDPNFSDKWHQSIGSTTPISRIPQYVIPWPQYVGRITQMCLARLQSLQSFYPHMFDCWDQWPQYVGRITPIKVMDQLYEIHGTILLDPRPQYVDLNLQPVESTP